MMDRSASELQSLTTRGVLTESIKILKSPPKTFTHITLALILPLSIAMLAHSLFAFPLLNLFSIQTDSPAHTTHTYLTQLFIMQFCYPVFLFVFSLLSTAAVVFTVASVYTARTLTFSKIIYAIPRVFIRLFITFLWVFLLMILYNLAYLACLKYLFVGNITVGLSIFLLIIITVAFGYIHICISALWHLATVVSVLEPVYGMEALKKSKELLKGKTVMAVELVFMYQFPCLVIEVGFVEVHYMVIGDIVGVIDSLKDHEVLIMSSLGCLVVGVLVVLNLIGLLVQSLFYYVCKSHHQQVIDKNSLWEHLDGYIGEHAPLVTSSVEMQSLQV